MPSTEQPTFESLSANLPASFTVQQIALLIASGVCEAYAAYNNGSNLAPKLAGYHAFNLIYVYEFDPNVNPFAASETQAAVAAVSKDASSSSTVSAAYAQTAGAAPTCLGPTPVGKPTAGYQLFGFTATADDLSHNLLVMRGTVTAEEAGYDLLGWGNNATLWLPTQDWNQTAYGSVNSYLLAFYQNNDTWTVTSMAASALAAIKNTVSQAPTLPWFVGGHSLGGAMVTLAVEDAVVSGAFAGKTPIVFTYGSLHVGDASFAAAYNTQVPFTFRVANLCDFVPSMVSLEPVTPTDPYVHVGVPGTFVWQTWDDWGNHSLANIYLPMVQSHWSIIQWINRVYPQ